MPKKKKAPADDDGHVKISEYGTYKRRRTKADLDGTPPPANLIERTNSLPLKELKSRFSDEALLSFDGSGPVPISHEGDNEGDEEEPKNLKYSIELYTSSTLPDELFNNCFDLLEANLSESYRLTTKGWQPRKKKEEMKHPAMRYLILTASEKKDPANDSQPSEFIGFLEFMVTEEEGWEVIYTYELDIIPSYQKLGLGKRLMDVAEEFGKRVGLEKAMLTVFDSNKGARRFYERHGYMIDEISPDVKVLRNGQVKQPTFHILSKSYEREDEEAQE